jgi:hypothetical protein
MRRARVSVVIPCAHLDHFSPADTPLPKAASAHFVPLDAGRNALPHALQTAANDDDEMTKRGFGNPRRLIQLGLFAIPGPAFVSAAANAFRHGWHLLPALGIGVLAAISTVSLVFGFGHIYGRRWKRLDE